MKYCPKCNSETKIASARKRLAYARQWTEYAAVCCTNKKCCWSIELSVYKTICAEAYNDGRRDATIECVQHGFWSHDDIDIIRAEARAEALREAADRAVAWYHSTIDSYLADDWWNNELRAAITQEPKP
jgi:hypothetical protein